MHGYYVKKGHYTDLYFLRTQEILKEFGLNPDVVMQVFAKKIGVLAGMQSVVRILSEYSNIESYGLVDGNTVEPRKPVLYIKGPYRNFAHLETPILGRLARATKIATNTREVVNAAKGKPVMYMGARHDDPTVQATDNDAAEIGGAFGVSTWAGGPKNVMGTIPHALIAVFGGDIVRATIYFHQTKINKGWDGKTVALVDYRNRCVEDSVAVANAMKETYGEESLYGVRLDTSETCVDESLAKRGWRGPAHHGVNPWLVRNVREALDVNGHEEVKIIVSGGFDADKIKYFEKMDVLVDGYGVGSSILKGNFDFTADIVAVNGKEEAKVGRRYIHNEKILGTERLV